MTDSISETVRQMWRDARRAAAETGVVDCVKIQELILRHKHFISESVLRVDSKHVNSVVFAYRLSPTAAIV